MMDSGIHYSNVPIARPRPIRLLFVAEAPPGDPATSPNYFYNLDPSIPSAWPARSFFWGMMQGVGLVAIGERTLPEKSLLGKFFANGFFLIDAIPKPIRNKPSNFVVDPETVMKTLFPEIDRLRPQRVVFVCKSTRRVLRAYREEPGHVMLLRDEPLPYPGNGWLTRPRTGDGFHELFRRLWPPR